MGSAARLASGIAALIATASAALGAPLIVMDAHGVPLRPGQAIDDTKTLDLAAGQSITVITPTGDTLRLRGPYHQRPKAGTNGGGSLTVAFSSLLVRGGVRASDVGAVRGGQPVRLPEPWVIDVSHPGTRCVREGQPIIFWRTPGDQARVLDIAPVNRAWRLTAPWPGGVDRLAAPKELPLVTRATYVIDIGDGPVAITLLVIPASFENDRMRAAWMFEKSCNLQAETLVQRLEPQPPRAEALR
jgi:hypothetical protein